MSVAVNFNSSIYNLQITNHAHARMVERGVSESLIVSIIEKGKSKQKPQQKNAFWVFADVNNRSDNLVCISLVIESENLVVKTVLINWRPV